MPCWSSPRCLNASGEKCVTRIGVDAGNPVLGSKPARVLSDGIAGGTQLDLSGQGGVSDVSAIRDARGSPHRRWLSSDQPTEATCDLVLDGAGERTWRQLIVRQPAAGDLGAGRGERLPVALMQDSGVGHARLQAKGREWLVGQGSPAVAGPALAGAEDQLRSSDRSARGADWFQGHRAYSPNRA